MKDEDQHYPDVFPTHSPQIPLDSIPLPSPGSLVTQGPPPIRASAHTASEPLTVVLPRPRSHPDVFRRPLQTACPIPR